MGVGWELGGSHEGVRRGEGRECVCGVMCSDAETACVQSGSGREVIDCSRYARKKVTGGVCLLRVWTMAPAGSVKLL